MSRKIPLAAVFRASCAILLPAFTYADTIVLKTGERIEAVIISDDGTTIEAEIKVSPSITDGRTFSKDEIQRIEKPDPAENTYENLAPLRNNPNSISLEHYDAAIAGKIQPFLQKYSTSTRIPDVEALLKMIQVEKERVAKGEVKVENEWFTPEEVLQFKPQISSTLLFQKMRTLGQSGDFISALNAFAQIEKDFPGSPTYPKAVEFAAQIIPKIQNEINARRVILKSDLEEREKGLAVLPDFRKQPLIQAAADEEVQNNAALEALLKSGQKWTPIYPRHSKSIDELQKTVTSEATRLAAIPVASLSASVAATQEARKQIAQADYDTATATLQKATTLWSANSLVKPLQDEIAAAKTAAADAAKAAEEAAKATPTPAPLAESTPVGSNPATSLASTAPTTAPTTATPIPTLAPTLVPTPPPEPPPSFFLTIPGAIAILTVTALLAAVISFLAKKKKISAESH